VKNLVLLATGIDYSTREGLINLWTDPRYFDVDKFVDTMGNVPAEFLQSAFLLLKPIANLIKKPINLMENIHWDEFVEDYLYMETPVGRENQVYSRLPGLPIAPRVADKKAW
jgi:polyhydroxyalkanoate synthase subunit PhaC